VRCFLPAGFAFVLYREYDQKGPHPLVIEGGSAVVEIPDLGAHQFSDAALSCAVVALRAARQLEDATWFPSA
jgi:hypothetical protein